MADERGGGGRGPAGGPAGDGGYDPYGRFDRDRRPGENRMFGGPPPPPPRPGVGGDWAAAGAGGGAPWRKDLKLPARRDTSYDRPPPPGMGPGGGAAAGYGARFASRGGPPPPGGAGGYGGAGAGGSQGLERVSSAPAFSGGAAGGGYDRGGPAAGSGWDRGAPGLRPSPGGGGAPPPPPGMMPRGMPPARTASGEWGSSGSMQDFRRPGGPPSGPGGFSVSHLPPPPRQRTPPPRDDAAADSDREMGELSPERGEVGAAATGGPDERMPPPPPMPHVPPGMGDLSRSGSAPVMAGPDGGLARLHSMHASRRPGGGWDEGDGGAMLSRPPPSARADGGLPPPPGMGLAPVATPSAGADDVAMEGDVTPTPRRSRIGWGQGLARMNSEGVATPSQAAAEGEELPQPPVPTDFTTPMAARPLGATPRSASALMGGPASALRPLSPSAATTPRSAFGGGLLSSALASGPAAKLAALNTPRGDTTLLAGGPASVLSRGFGSAGNFGVAAGLAAGPAAMLAGQRSPTAQGGPLSPPAGRAGVDGPTGDPQAKMKILRDMERLDSDIAELQKELQELREEEDDAEAPEDIVSSDPEASDNEDDDEEEGGWRIPVQQEGSKPKESPSPSIRRRRSELQRLLGDPVAVKSPKAPKKEEQPPDEDEDEDEEMEGEQEEDAESDNDASILLDDEPIEVERASVVLTREHAEQKANVQSVLEENRRRAEQSHRDGPQPPADTPLKGLQPQDMPFYERNDETHATIGPIVQEVLRKRRRTQADVDIGEAIRYRKLREMWRQRLLAAQARKAAQAEKKGEKERPVSLRSSSRLRPNMSGVVRSDYEELQILSQLQAAERLRTLVRLPTMITNEDEKRIQRFPGKNALIEDPVAEVEAEKHHRPWTEDERKIFLEKFQKEGKQFRKIASFLTNRSVQECIVFYYRNQKDDPGFRSKRKAQLKKRRQYVEVKRTAGSFLTAGPSAPTRVQPKEDKQKDKSAIAAAKQAKKDARIAAKEQAQAKKVAKLKEKEAARPTNIVKGARSAKPGAKARAPPGGASGAEGAAGRPAEELAARAEDRTAFSSEEKRRFIEGLELYGKDFRQISNHVGTRNVAAVKAYFGRHRKDLNLDALIQDHRSRAVPASADGEQQEADADLGAAQAAAANFAPLGSLAGLAAFSSQLGQQAGLAGAPPPFPGVGGPMGNPVLAAAAAMAVAAQASANGQYPGAPPISPMEMVTKLLQHHASMAAGGFPPPAAAVAPPNPFNTYSNSLQPGAMMAAVSAASNAFNAFFPGGMPPNVVGQMGQANPMDVLQAAMQRQAAMQQAPQEPAGAPAEEAAPETQPEDAPADPEAQAEPPHAEPAGDAEEEGAAPAGEDEGGAAAAGEKRKRDDAGDAEPAHPSEPAVVDDDAAAAAAAAAVDDDDDEPAAKRQETAAPDEAQPAPAAAGAAEAAPGGDDAMQVDEEPAAATEEPAAQEGPAAEDAAPEP